MATDNYKTRYGALNYDDGKGTEDEELNGEQQGTPIVESTPVKPEATTATPVASTTTPVATTTAPAKVTKPSTTTSVTTSSKKTTTSSAKTTPATTAPTKTETKTTTAYDPSTDTRQLWDYGTNDKPEEVEVPNAPGKRWQEYFENTNTKPEDETPEQKAKRERLQRWEMITRGLGELWGHIANIRGAAKGATPLKLNNSLTGQWAERYEKMKADRKAAGDKYNEGLNKARMQDWADYKNDREFALKQNRENRLSWYQQKQSEINAIKTQINQLLALPKSKETEQRIKNLETEQRYKEQQIWNMQHGLTASGGQRYHTGSSSTNQEAKKVIMKGKTYKNVNEAFGAIPPDKKNAAMDAAGYDSNMRALYPTPGAPWLYSIVDAYDKMK